MVTRDDTGWIKTIRISNEVNRYPLREFEAITNVKPLTGVYLNPTNLTDDQIKGTLNIENNSIPLWNAFSEANPELKEAFPDPSREEMCHIIMGVISEFPIVDIQHYLAKSASGITIPQDVTHYTALERLIQYTASWRLSPTQLAHLKAQFCAELDTMR